MLSATSLRWLRRGGAGSTQLQLQTVWASRTPAACPRASQASRLLSTSPSVVFPHTVIHPTAKIGKRCRIGPFTFIGEDVEIGDDTIIGSNAALVNCTIGNHVVLHAGVRIGQDGFGFQLASSGDHAKKPQELRVEIHDYVEIGANCAIDRGSWRNTVLGKGCKLDNLIQIGHNVQLGKGCVIAAQTGIAGSTTLGNNVHIGGQVGIAQHLQIGENVRIAAKSGVMNHLASNATYGKVNIFESMIAEEKADVVPLYYAIQEEHLPYRSWSSAVKWRI